MNFDDQQTKDFEKKFNEWNSKENLTLEDVEKLKKGIEDITEPLSRLVEKPDKTEEEIQFLARIKPVLFSLSEKLQDAMILHGERAFRTSMKYYEHVKKLAAEGNEEAKKVFEEMDVLYKKMLAEQASEN